MSTKNTESSLLPLTVCIFVMYIFEGCSLLPFVGFGSVHTYMDLQPPLNFSNSQMNRIMAMMKYIHSSCAYFCGQDIWHVT